MVTALEPISRGIVAVHWVIPAAVPDWPVLVIQVIEVTPTLSLAVPLNTIEDEEVETEVDEGETIVSEGGVVSFGDFGAVGVEGGVGAVVC